VAERLDNGMQPRRGKDAVYSAVVSMYGGLANAPAGAGAANAICDAKLPGALLPSLIIQRGACEDVLSSRLVE